MAIQEDIVDVCCRILKEFRYLNDYNKIHGIQHSGIYSVEEIYNKVISDKRPSQGTVTLELIKQGIEILANKHGLLGCHGHVDWQDGVRYSY